MPFVVKTISACPGATVTVDGLEVKNEGRPFAPTKGNEEEKYLIRYNLVVLLFC